MRLRFANHRSPTTVDELEAFERAQLVSAGVAWDGVQRTAEDRLAPGDKEYSFLGFVHVRDVLDDDNGGQLAYTYWSYAGDSGAFFVGQTDVYDADVIQGYLHNPKTPALARALAEAAKRQWDALKGSRFRVNPRVFRQD